MLQDLKTTSEVLSRLAKTLPIEQWRKFQEVLEVVENRISLLETHYAAQDNEQAREELEMAVA